MAANNYIKVIGIDGKVIRIVPFDDTDRTQTENALSLARTVCPPKGRLIAYRDADRLHVDGFVE